MIPNIVTFEICPHTPGNIENGDLLDIIMFGICSQIPTKIGREKRAVISWIHSRRSIANGRSMPGLP